MLREYVGEACLAVGVDADEAALDALVLHAGMMLATNETLNLTRITDLRDVAYLHVADSLSALPFLLAAPEGAFADLGSGAGYPGIPLAIMSGRPVTLIESRGKKARFLEEVVDAVGLTAEVVALRAEEAALQRRTRFSAVTARALAPLASLVELAAPLLKPGGVLIALKGEPADGETRSGDAAAEMAGMGRVASKDVAIPGLDARRTIVTYERQGDPKVRLPRRPGMAQRSPLA